MNQSYRPHHANENAIGHPHLSQAKQQATQQRSALGDISNQQHAYSQQQYNQSASGVYKPNNNSGLGYPQKPQQQATRVPLANSGGVAFQQQQQQSTTQVYPQQQQRTLNAAPSMSQPMAVSPVSEAGKSYLAKPEQFVAPPRSPGIDSLHFKDPQHATDYVYDIFVYHKSAETKYMAPHNYMERQTDVTSNMRSVLVDWLIEVHESFELMPDTLYLTINLIDRFLSVVVISRSKLQLAGVAAMLIASKYEEIECPDVDEFIKISANAFSKDELLRMERLILSSLNFNVTVTTAYPFLMRYLKCGACSQRAHYMAYMLSELVMLEIEALKFTPSMIACSSIYLAQKFLGFPDAWNSNLQYYSGYSEQDLRACSQMILNITHSQAIERRKPADRRKLQSVIKKYDRVADLLMACYQS